jgi:glycosyltransferase involved in cell wall biosynthesis
MLEGYYHGKNLLFSDSIYQGGRDYFGDRAYYFKDGDFDDFTEKIQMLWNIKDEYVNLEDRKKFCEQYTIEAMTGRIIENLKRLKSE